MILLRRSFIFGAALLPAACESPEPNVYVLTARPGVIRYGGPKTVVLRPIELPSYLQRPQIVRSNTGSNIDVLPGDQWGEPLGAMLQRVLVDDLAERLPDCSVHMDGDAPSAVDVAVAVSIQRMDLDASGAMDLSAQITADEDGRPDAISRGVALSVRPADDSSPALVAAMNIAVGRLADSIAAVLT